MRGTNSARLRTLAKINLDLRVIARRPDGFHELRTIFQTISLSDTIDISFTPSRSTSIDLKDRLAIPDNLVMRAARMAMDAMRTTGRESPHQWAAHHRGIGPERQSRQHVRAGTNSAVNQNATSISDRSAYRLQSDDA